ncbi:MAG TPA: type II toxin-antitoxin system RelE/ParE family toxin [Usitatibacter sp.]|jgi:putative addiction module killer protein|nr:type II toxin-antitoxin system RelE/ParE family toxin [Usitatibacter sp.]
MELRYYQASSGRRPFVEWLEALQDRRARARVQARLAVVASGSLGDVKSVGDGVVELRLHYGPGYRIYFALVSEVVILLLCGGDKRSQDDDIKQAKRYLEDFKRRTARAQGRC